MKSMEPKSHSQWWDSLISPENTKWLAENIEEVDNTIKGVFKLIEHDDNSSAETEANYEQKRPELIAHIGKFSRMHQLLAERYDHLIGEVRRNAPSLQQMHHLDVYDSGSPIASPMLTPDQKMGVNKSEEAVGFDLFISSGGGSSDNSVREGSASSVSSSSDSDSESLNSIHKHLASPLRNDLGYGTLVKKVNDYEEQLLVLNNKLQCSEEEIARLKGELKKTEEVTALMSNLQAQLEASQSEFKIQNTNLRMEREKVLELQNQVVELETQIYDSNSKIERMGEELEVKRAELTWAEDEITELKQSEGAHELQVQLQSSQKDVLFLQRQLDSEQFLILEMQEKISRHTADLSDRDNQIRELNAAFSDANEKFSHEKSHVLEQEALLKARVDSLEIEIKQYEAENSAMISFHEANIEMLEAELQQKDESVEDLNKNFDVLKLKYDTLKVEKDQVIAQVDVLRAEACSRENLLREMEKQLCQLKTEHTGLVSQSDTARKLADELKARVEELEKEVERQSNVISDRAEEKREAIRQLCFSLEHYRVGYKELREAYVVHKRNAVVA